MQRIAHVLNGHIINVSLAADDFTPANDGSRMLESEAFAAGIPYAPPPSTVKAWPNVQAFMAEFTMEQKAAISLSTNPTVAALRLELTTWFDSVRADDARVIAGMQALASLGIITETQRAAILGL